MGISWRSVVAVVSLAAVGLVGCGDDEDRLTEEAFLEQGNAICKAGNERLDQLFEENFQSEEDFQDEAKQAEVKEQLEDDIQGQIDDVRELEPPEELEDDVEAFLDDAQAALDDLRDMSTEEFFSQEEDPFEDINRQADEIGLTECAEDGEEEGEGGDEEAAPGHTVVEVTALEYKFELGSTTMAAGPTALHLANTGEEDHELSIARIAEGHTLQEALEFEGDPEEAGLIVEPMAHAFAAPGEDSYANVELIPGTYAMVCFVEAPDGTPHALKGMVAEFTVE